MSFGNWSTRQPEQERPDKWPRHSPEGSQSVTSLPPASAFATVLRELFRHSKPASRPFLRQFVDVVKQPGHLANHSSNLAISSGPGNWDRSSGGRAVTIR